MLGLANGSGLAERSQAPAAAVPDLATLQVLDLKTAGRIALAGNPSVAATRARVRQAREQVIQANAAYWPRLDATASASRITLSDNAHTASLASARLFDPTAAIDPATEGEILEAMDNAMKGRTTFVVAHRLSTLRATGINIPGGFTGGTPLSNRRRRRYPAPDSKVRVGF